MQSLPTNYQPIKQLNQQHVALFEFWAFSGVSTSLDRWEPGKLAIVFLTVFRLIFLDMKNPKFFSKFKFHNTSILEMKYNRLQYGNMLKLVK